MGAGPIYDLAIIGAGITGLGIFERAARAGLSCALIDRGRAGGATTAVTSGLFHGGLRYLPYDAATAYRMCREIGRLRSEAPELMARQPFLWPVYRGDPAGPGAVGALMDYYDSLCALRGAPPHRRLSPLDAATLVPGLALAGLRVAFAFEEWRADVPRLVAHLARGAMQGGGRLFEDRRAVGFDREDGALKAVRLSGGRTVAARLFVNAAGPWAGEVAALGGARVDLCLRAGTHLVVEGTPPPVALLLRGPGGRYIGLYPRCGESWIGPTDTPFDGAPDEARAAPEEEGELRRCVGRVLPGLRERAGRVSVGLRPLFKQWGAAAFLSRDHRVIDHAAEGTHNLITVVGGKLTTYRPMADDALRLASAKLGRPEVADVEAPGEEARLPWRWLGAHSRGVSLALSGAMLAYFVLRRAAGLSTEAVGLDARER